MVDCGHLPGGGRMEPEDIINNNKNFKLSSRGSSLPCIYWFLGTKARNSPKYRKIRFFRYKFCFYSGTCDSPQDRGRSLSGRAPHLSWPAHCTPRLTSPGTWPGCSTLLSSRVSRILSHNCVTFDLLQTGPGSPVIWTTESDSSYRDKLISLNGQVCIY